MNRLFWLLCLMLSANCFRTYAEVKEIPGQEEWLRITNAGGVSAPFKFFVYTDADSLRYRIISPSKKEVMFVDLYNYRGLDYHGGTDYCLENNYVIPANVCIAGDEYKVTMASNGFFFPKFKSLTLPLTMIKTDKEFCSSSIGGYCSVDLGNIEVTGPYNFNDIKIERITLPASLYYIENNSFSCDTKSITFNEGLKIVGNNCFENCWDVKVLELPTSLISPLENCFNFNVDLERVVLPVYLRSAYHCFNECEGIKEIVSPAPTAPDYAKCFQDVDKKKCKVYVPKGSSHSYLESNFWRSFNIVEDETLNSISEAFNLDDPRVSSPFGFPVFTDDDGLEYRIISPELKEVMFIDLYSHRRDPNIVTDYTEYKDYVVPSEVMIGGESYRVVMVDRNISFASFKSLTLPSSLKMINLNFLNTNESIESLDLGGVEVMGFKSVCNTKKLREITLPESLYYIQENCFNYNESLEKITFNDGLVFLSSNCFNDNKKVTSVVLPSTLNRGLVSNFNNCTSLQRVVLPFNLGEARQCFNGAPGITEIVSPSTVAPDFTNCFDCVDKKTCILYVPKGSAQSYLDSSFWKGFNIVEDANLDAQDIPAVESNGEEEIYTIDGIRIPADATLNPGEFYIRKQGNDAMKIMQPR